jgi:hypothetical protein
MGRQQHRCHGDPRRFEIVAEFIADRYGKHVRTIADVAGGQGLLAHLLSKKYHYESEVIDPRGFVLKGVVTRAEEFDPAYATYYDLIVGMHPDEAMREVAQAALVRPVVLIPCCNFWSPDRLGRDELVEAVAKFYASKSVRFERVAFAFKGPKNIGLVSEPPMI